LAGPSQETALFAVADQAAALAAAIKQAKAKGEAGSPAEVRLNRTDGEVVVQSLDE
jgi:hypothetical protein